MSVFAERRMHRYTEEDVAAVVWAAVGELRRRQGDKEAMYYPRADWDLQLPGRRERELEKVRSIRSGVLPRDRYEASRGPDDPPYLALPQERRDEDRVLWLLTQALTEAGS